MTGQVVCPNCGEGEVVVITRWIDYRPMIVSDGKIIVGETQSEVPDETEPTLYNCESCGENVEVADLLAVNGIAGTEDEAVVWS